MRRPFAERTDASSIASRFADNTFDLVIFWAAPEHMTVDERVRGIGAAWDRLEVAGVLTVMETRSAVAMTRTPRRRPSSRGWTGWPTGLGPDRTTEHPQPRSRPGAAALGAAQAPSTRRQVTTSSTPRSRSAHGSTSSRSRSNFSRQQPFRWIGWRLPMDGRHERITDPAVPVAFLRPLLHLTLQKPVDPAHRSADRFPMIAVPWSRPIERWSPVVTQAVGTERASPG
jgi:hypothetical protein